MNKPFPDPSLGMRHDLHPGDIGYIIYMHGIFHALEQGWDHTFEVYVAVPLAEFAQSKSSREKIWILEEGDRIAGSVAIVKRTEEEAQLRWLLLEPEIRGRGIGKWLVEEALDFSRISGYESIFLWTVETLYIAANLYRSVGFVQRERLTHEIWGSTVTEVKYELPL
ncbi:MULTISPECIES: GNAT family N-acetyltransferase [Methanothrix]|jgi:GNAT superfamily N-acetyltransferase|uniref:GNAT family N-acetyltransferase n=3 Tax=Methanothrix soehngenii TaxID=2223 RepID=A0A7K4AHC6_METSH|nr:MULTISPECIES: GNAT family N-acetyltransferase [Methanothrix]MBP7068470.1 GNAT family N-acetyltransferase [Methanothrix sp.]MDY0412552.1 GNAT family N-acetyltransferase [Methanothrix soehngenii]NLJ22389.1 GNAT family N-acetyltransferase [Methanothrix soehngenii]